MGKGSGVSVCRVACVFGVSCVIVLVDSEARGAAPSEVMPPWFCFWVRGKQGVGSGFINEFENAAKGIIFVKK